MSMSMKITNLFDKKIAILWAGREGKSTFSFLQKLWVTDITILDKDQKLENIQELWENISMCLWEQYLDGLSDFDIIFKAPGISPYTEKKLQKQTEKLCSQAEIFFDNYDWKIITVTGTKGKSTLSSLIYYTLQKAWFRVKLVGNIGKPVLDEIDLISWEKYDFVVYEMSSYMLENFQPKSEIALLNNVYNDHLDWYDFDEVLYQKAKLNILSQAKSCLLWSCDFLRKHISWENFYGKKWKYFFSEKSFYIQDKEFLSDPKILLQWEHNRHNICWVIWVCDILGIEKKYLLWALEEFSGLEHRMEKVWTFDEIVFIDDAISTTPESTIAAIDTFAKGISTIFLWGKDRGYVFENLYKKIEEYQISNIVLFWESGKRIFREFFSQKNSLNILKTESMKQAVKFAFEKTTKWKICLLSTASPSYGIWKNFEEQWDEFKKYIYEYSEKITKKEII